MDIVIKPLSYEEKISIAKSPPLRFFTMPINAHHFDYLDRLFIKWPTITKYEIQGLKELYMGPKKVYTHKDYNFGFFWKVGDIGEKGYIPFNRWKNKHGVLKPRKFFHQNLVGIEGLDKLSMGGDLLVWTKSMKDILVLDSLGYNAISCSSESMFGLLDDNLRYRLSSFKELVIWGDPDPAGERYAQEIKEFMGRGRIATSVGGKDPSDIIINTRDVNTIHQIIRNAK